MVQGFLHENQVPVPESARRGLRHLLAALRVAWYKVSSPRRILWRRILHRSDDVDAEPVIRGKPEVQKTDGRHPQQREGSEREGDFLGRSSVVYCLRSHVQRD